MFSAATKTGAAAGYQISRSLRFNSADSAYLNRTPASASNRTTWSWSGWVKRSALGSAQYLYGAQTPATETEISFNSSDQIYFLVYVSGVVAGELITTQVFRDLSAWYHICVVYDSTNATSGDRMRLYVNGSRITALNTATYPAQNTQGYVNNNVLHTLGTYSASLFFFNGYMTEVNFIDGQALTPSSFGETNAQTGVWQPKAYAGSYGTNGFYLNFSDNSNTTAATLGKDYSGNGNNWTPNNFSVAAGAGNDSLVDSPTAYGTDTGAGGTVRGNYATLNPLDNGVPSSGLTLANGNLQLTGIASNWRAVRSTVAMSSGKWYCEATVTALSGTLYARVGLATSSAPLDNYLGSTAASWCYINTGNKSTNLSNDAYGASWTTNDVVGIAFDADAGTLTFYKNGVSQGQAFSGLTSGPYFFAVSVFDPQVMYFNFGQRPFAYTAPSGFKALCTQNLPTPTIGATSTTLAVKYFNPVLYTGNGSTQSVTGVGFQPDLVWNKQRSSSVGNNWLNDAVRGAGNSLSSNSTNAESAYSAYFTSFSSDGFSLAGGTDGFNASGSTYVSWNWKANGAGSSNTAGSITSTVSANTTSGFSIATWTGTGSGTATIGHGLGVAPSMIILKFRNTTSNWSIYHASLGNTKRLTFTTAAEETDSTIWNNTSPTSTVFTTGTTLNQSFTYVAYCFAAVAGYNAFGSYTGNGSSDGPFVFTGMRPAFIMIKRTDNVGSWIMLDTVRNTFNVMDKTLWANLSDAEGTYTILDAVSNGFKLRDASNGYNNNGATYIYATFASNPFKYSLAR